MTISGFEGEHRWLSNFWPAIIRFDQANYPSVEHAYQAAKTVSPAERVPFMCGHRYDIEGDFELSGRLAKTGGKQVTLRHDWDEVKLMLMEKFVRLKFANDEELLRRLVATAGQDIIESNWWNDTFWGVCRGVGENHLGKIIMAVREELIVDLGEEAFMTRKNDDVNPPAAVVIFGSRAVSDSSLVGSVVEKTALFKSGRIKTVISGKAPGADRAGETWAHSKGIEVIDRPAAWDDISVEGAIVVTREDGTQYNKRAGMDRNLVMARECTHGIGFWDGKSPGTREMIAMLVAENKPHVIYRTDTGEVSVWPKPEQASSETVEQGFDEYGYMSPMPY